MLGWLARIALWVFAGAFLLAFAGLSIAAHAPLAEAIGKALAIAAGTLAGAVVLAVLWREWGRARIRRRRRIRTAAGIDLIETVTIGGIEQWIQVRGQDATRPVILFLHGGPGAAELPFSHLVQDAWEEHFVCVQWDQRGAGKTYCLHDPAAIRPTLTIDRMVSDTLEVIDHVRSRLGQEAVVLHGHSWGSALGALVAKRCPRKVLALVGEGQVVNMLDNERASYDFTLAEAERRGDARAIEALSRIGRPPYPPGAYMASATIQRGWLRKYGYGGRRGSGRIGYMWSALYRPLLLSPDYSLREAASYMDALYSTGTAFTTGGSEYLEFDLRGPGPDYEVPVFFFTGRLDYVTPGSVSAEYFEQLVAPHKDLVWFENSAHSPQREEPERYLAEFLARVAPFANPARRAQSQSNAG